MKLHSLKYCIMNIKCCCFFVFFEQHYHKTFCFWEMLDVSGCICYKMHKLGPLGRIDHLYTKYCSSTYILWKTPFPWTPPAQTLLVQCPPRPHHWLSGLTPVYWSLTPSSDTLDSQTCAGRTKPQAGPATETEAPHSETQRRYILTFFILLVNGLIVCQ